MLISTLKARFVEVDIPTGVHIKLDFEDAETVYDSGGETEEDE